MAKFAQRSGTDHFYHEAKQLLSELRQFTVYPLPPASALRSDVYGGQMAYQEELAKEQEEVEIRHWPKRLLSHANRFEEWLVIQDREDEIELNPLLRRLRRESIDGNDLNMDRSQLTHLLEQHIDRLRPPEHISNSSQEAHVSVELRSAIARHGHTQKEAAYRLGVAETTLKRWLSAGWACPLA